MVVDPTMAFLVIAGAVQAAFGVTMLVRRARVEWAVLVAMLFVLNGASALLLALLRLDLPFPGKALTGTINDYDLVTTYLLLYLALAYPSRPASLRSRPWVLPLVCGGVAVAVLVSRISGNPGPTIPWLDVPLRMLVHDWVLSGVAFPLLTIRWAILLGRETSPIRRREQALMLAAFGIRATHIGVLVPMLRLGADLNTAEVDPGLILHTSLQLLQIVGVVGAVVHLGFARLRASQSTRRDLDVALGFLVMGLLIAMLDASRYVIRAPYYDDPVLHLDLIVVRPLLVWYLLVRHDVLAFRRTSQVMGAVVLVLLIAAGFYGGLASLGGDTAAGRGIGLTLVAAVELAVLLAGALLVRHIVRRPPESPVEVEAENAQRFANAAEDAFRNGNPGAAELRSLDALRDVLGLEPAQAQAILAAVMTRWRSHPTRQWRPGDAILGRYRLEAILGQGGSGEAWRAHDDLAGGTVVLKRARAAEPDALRTFQREAEALGRVRHPNVVRLLATEDLGTEVLLVLEHLPGGSLQSRLESGPMAPSDALRVAGEVLAGLQAIHDAGLVHRDLKPGNVLFDAAGHAKVSDLGVATASAAPSLGDPTPSAHRQAGSLRYMAPEQVRGDAATPRSDLYAVGLLLLQMLSGRHPVPAHLNDYDTRRWIVEGPAPDLPKSPAHVRAALEAALARDPASRPRDARAMANALRVPAATAPPVPLATPPPPTAGVRTR